MQKKACAKSWSHIVRKKCNNIVLSSYQNSVKNNIVWSDKIKNEFAAAGLYGISLKADNNNMLVETYYSSDW